MYLVQRLYCYNNPFRTVFQKIRCYTEDMADCFQKGIKAAEVAEKNPMDRETVLRIFKAELD